MKHIIDLSHHNKVVNWDKLKNVIDGVIIRLGYGNRHDDKKGAEYVRAAIEHNIPYAIYWYSYALTKDQIVNEADAFMDAYYRLGVSVPPVFFSLDMEDADGYKSKNGKFANEVSLILHCSDLIPFWLLQMKDKTNIPLCVYMNNYWWSTSNYYPDKDIIRWVARWSEKEPTVTYDLWQFSNKASVAGIQGYVDVSRTDDQHKLWINKDLEEILYQDENVRLILKNEYYCLEVMR